ncbi:MAG: hypothetical protein KF726_03995 [Anaerolineae bacterium]|nr:hypothetical protein [Anaerolineae bacterium]
MSQKRIFSRAALLLLLLGSFIWTFGSASTNVKAESDVTFENPQTESNFRQNLIFQITVKSRDAKIVSAVLLLRERGTETYSRYRVDSFAAATQVDLVYVEDTVGFTTPPWQVLIYQWEVVDEAGNKFRSEEMTTEYADHTRDWQKLEGKGVTVYWYDQPVEFGQLVLASAEKGYSFVSAATNFQPTDNIRIAVYNTQSDYCSYWAQLTCKEWYGATTHNTVVVTQDFPDERAYLLDSIIPHELAHAFLHMRVGNNFISIPNWFNEGQAMNNEIASIEPQLERVRELAALGQIGRLALLEGQTSITRDEFNAVSDWYATATSLIYFLYEQFTPAILGKILDGVAADKSFEQAFEDATGWTLEQYELKWRAWLGITAPPPTFVPTETMPAFFATPTFVPTKAP